ncbi:MAG TPA: metallophosphoesterase [Actinomycetota bacterium]|nr:metallophosphoesterase [Actinomycetota bacterium]
MDERPRVDGLRRAIGWVLLALVVAVVGLQLRTCEFGEPSSPGSTSASIGARPSSTPGAGSGGGLVLIAAGDIACAPGSSATPTGCHQDTTAALVTAGSGGPVTAVLLLGDTQYESGRAEDYASFDATWGQAIRASGGDVLPVAGNHEWYDPDPAGSGCTLQHGGRNACGFESYFGAAALDGTMADGAGNYVRIFAEQAAHPLVVIMIDAGVCEHDPTVCRLHGAATQFLARALADRQVNPPAACTLVAWHQARWSDVGHGSIGYVDPLWEGLFDVQAAQRPDVVLNGHDHVYERMPPLGSGGQPNPGGIPEIVAGAGGREIAGLPYAGPVPTRAAYIDLQHFGVLRLDHDAATVDLATSFRTEGGAIVDAQRLTCRT